MLTEINELLGHIMRTALSKSCYICANWKSFYNIFIESFIPQKWSPVEYQIGMNECRKILLYPN